MFKYLIQIRYKSGHMIEEWFTEFKREEHAGKISITWKLLVEDQQFIYMGVQDIESIFVVKKEEIED